MIFNQVQVDDEVYEYVKRHAVPLEDDFNSALKRLLNIGTIQKSEKKSNNYINNVSKIRPIPPGTPQALVQILEVVQYVKNGISRKEATRLVAMKHNVAPQTVLDKYCRQLGLTASEFDKLLSDPKLIEIISKLKWKFNSFQDVIDDILN